MTKKKPPTTYKHQYMPPIVMNSLKVCYHINWIRDNQGADGECKGVPMTVILWITKIPCQFSKKDIKS